jgi:double-stranded uracil-DNA glycosylase
MGLGLTDLVTRRAASSDPALAKRDYDVSGFLARVESAAPQVIAFNGGKAADQVSRFLGLGPSTEGPADWRIGPSLVYRLPSSSAAASIGTERKIAAWRAFGDWVRHQTG